MLKISKIKQSQASVRTAEMKKGELILLCSIDKNYFSLVYVHMESVFALFLSAKKVVLCLFYIFLFDFGATESTSQLIEI